MFKKLILDKDLTEMLGDYTEIIENICYYGDDDDCFQDEKFEQINYFCENNNCNNIVNNYGTIKAIKLYNNEFGDFDFDESESKINKKLAFMIIYDFLHFVDLDFYNQYMKEDCGILIYCNDYDNIIDPIESSIKNFHYKVSNRFYPIF